MRRLTCINEGFALLEALVAVTLAALTIAVLLGALLRALATERTALQQGVALRALSEVTELPAMIRRPDGQALVTLAAAPGDAAETAAACAASPSACAAETAAAAWRDDWHRELARDPSLRAVASLSSLTETEPGTEATLQWPGGGSLLLWAVP